LGTELFRAFSKKQVARSRIINQTEGDLEQALMAVQLLFYLMGGLGLFFLGVGVLWFVDIYKKKNA
jgi:hypothetical protein